MAFIPVPGATQLNVRYLYHGQQVQNTLYATGVPTTDSGALFSLAGSLYSAWETFVLPNLVSALTLTEVNAVGLGSETDPSVTFTGDPPATGGVVGLGLPANAAFVIKFGTAQRGRSSRGRIYLVGLRADSVVDSVLDAGYADALRDSVRDAIFDAFTSQALTHVIVSRFSGGQPRAQGVTLPVISYPFTDLALDSQRRRLPTRGT